MRAGTLSISPPPRVMNGLGIGASGLCITHCLLMPAVLLLLPVVGLAMPEESRVHAIMLTLVLGIGAVAFGVGFGRHRRAGLLAMPVAGMTLLGTGAFWGDALGGYVEPLLTVTGGALMIGSHWLNQSFCRACPQCCDDLNCGLAETTDVARP
jgi:hypothetical protein